MAKGDRIAEDELVVRAGRHPYWDPALNRATPSAFTQAEVSVSRLAVLDIKNIVSIFNKDFGDRVSSDGQSMKVLGYGQATVAQIIQEAERPIGEPSAIPNFFLTVVEDKIENEPDITDNPAHALICGWSREDLTQSRKISRGVAKRLLDVFNWTAIDG
jgi:hypothetical protein